MTYDSLTRLSICTPFQLISPQEQVQLNVALQTEIVRFTVLGIQKAIRDVEESMAEQERNSTGGTSFFVSALFSHRCRGCTLE